MNLLRIYQYIQRIAYVYLTSLPGGYQKRKLRILNEMLDLGCEFMNKLNEEYWLDFGTLLGYHREGGVIPHDIDVDFSMPSSKYSRVLAMSHLVPGSLKLHDTSFRHHGPKLYLSYKGFDIDIYFYEERNGYLQSTERTGWENERQKIPSELIYPLKQAYFVGHSIQIPAQTERYLKKVYGYLGSDAARNKVTGFWEKI